MSDLHFRRRLLPGGSLPSPTNLVVGEPLKPNHRQTGAKRRPDPRQDALNNSGILFRPWKTTGLGCLCSRPESSRDRDSPASLYTYLSAKVHYACRAHPTRWNFCDMVSHHRYDPPRHTVMGSMFGTSDALGVGVTSMLTPSQV